MRLIDADALVEKHRETCSNSMKYNLDLAPTVDAVPVVRCRDCRKFKTYGCRMVASGYDDFCSYGERKDGGSDAQES